MSVRERSSEAHLHEERRRVFDRGRRRFFDRVLLEEREVLRLEDRGVGRVFWCNFLPISAFNLNPYVGLLGLWGLFKAFGKVRDEYFSSNLSAMRWDFDFIQYGFFGGSLEEGKSGEKDERLWVAVSVESGVFWSEKLEGDWI